MRPALQFRLWWRQAPLAHRAVTAVVGLVALTLVLVSFRGPDTKTLASGSADDGGASTSVTGGGDTASASTAPDGTTTVTNADGTTTITNADGTTTTVPAGGSTAGAAASSGAKPSTSASAAPMKSAAASAAAVDISKATDQGVNSCGSAPCVKIGVLISNVGGLSASGFALAQRTDLQDVVQRYVDYLNAHGGVNGRMVSPDFQSVNAIDQSDQQNKCTTLTEDDKVFGVIDTSSTIFAAQMACYSQDHSVPFIHSFAEDAAFQAKNPGYELTPVRNLDRIANEWVTETKTAGFIKSGDKVGILEDNCEPSHSVVANVLIPGLRSLGATGLKTYESDCTAASAQSQPPGYAATMCTDGVQKVYLATSFVAAQTFLQAADGTPCGTGPTKFQYAASDYSLLVSDLFDAKFSKTQFDGAFGITNSFTGQLQAGKAAPARLSFCNNAITEANKIKGTSTPLVTMDAANTETRQMCDNFFLMTDIATKVGGNLTRAAWAKQAMSYGTLEGVTTKSSLFKAGKYSGGDPVQTVKWLASCSCWSTTVDFHSTSG